MKAWDRILIGILSMSVVFNTAHLASTGDAWAFGFAIFDVFVIAGLLVINDLMRPSVVTTETKGE